MRLFKRSRKSWGDIKLEQAEKRAKQTPDGGLVLVQTYMTAMGLQRETQRMLEGGWTLTAQMQQGDRTVVTWTKPPPAVS